VRSDPVTNQNREKKTGPDAVRLTTKDGFLYAICFGWPQTGQMTIKALPARKPCDFAIVSKTSAAK